MLIELRNVTKSYRTDRVETLALGGVTFSLAEREFIVVRGPSGCGKSTLLLLMGLLEDCDSGEVIVGGVSTTEIDEAERARVRGLHLGFVFQSFLLIPQLTVRENVAAPLRYHRALTRAEIAERLDATLKAVGLEARADHLPAQLSGGQQQRVAIARAMAAQPKVLLADEPTGNLDQRTGDAVMDLIRALHERGTAVCMVTHDERYARAGTRRIEMRDGAIVDESTH